LLSTDPTIMEQSAADSMQESPFNYSSSKSNIRSFSRPHSSSIMPAAASPFASMFTADLTRFLSGIAFAEVRLAALGTDHTTAHNQLLCHASRLTRVSEVLRLQLGPMLKSLPARPMGYGGPEAQPLVVLDAPLPVLKAFHRLMYEATVAVPAAVLPGLLRLAVLYDMPELELWVLQQADVAGDKLVMPSGEYRVASVWYCC
jgi:hypothetical protein